MAANSPTTRYIVLVQKDGNNPIIPHNQRPDPDAILKSLLSISDSHLPFLDRNGVKNTYFVSTNPKRIDVPDSVGENLQLILSQQKPGSANFYFQIQELNGAIIQIDLFIDGIQHTFPLNEEGHLHKEDKASFEDRLRHVLNYSNYTQPKKKNHITVIPSTVWTTRNPKAKTGGIASKDMSLIRDNDPTSKTFGRVLVDTSKTQVYPRDDAAVLLPYIVLDFDNETQQFWGGTLYFPTKRAAILKDHERGAQKDAQPTTVEQYLKWDNMEAIRLTSIDIDRINHAIDPSETMANILQEKIPTHIFVQGIFDSVEKTRFGNFILQTGMPQERITATSHLAIEIAPRVFKRPEEDYRQSMILSPEQMDAFQRSLRGETVEISEEAEDEKKKEKSNLQMNDIDQEQKKAEEAKEIQRKREITQKAQEQTFSFDICAELSLNETKQYHIIKRVIIVDRKTHQATRVDIKKPFLHLAINDALFEMCFAQYGHLSPEDQLTLKFKVMMAIINTLILTEVNRNPNGPESLLFALCRDQGLNFGSLFNQHNMVKLDTIQKLKSISQKTVQQNSVSTLINSVLSLLVIHRSRQIYALSSFDFNNVEKLPGQLRTFAAFLKDLCVEKKIRGLDAVLYNLEQATSVPRIAGVINPRLITVLNELKAQVSQLKDDEINLAITHALEDVNQEYKANIKEAIVSFDTLNFESGKTPEQNRLDVFLQLIISLALAANKFSPSAKAAFQVLQDEKLLVRLEGRINPKWITALQTLQDELPDAQIKELIGIVKDKLQTEYLAEIERETQNITDLDFSKNESLIQAGQAFLKLITHMANESARNPELEKILSELKPLLQDPRSEDIVKLKLLITLDKLIDKTKKSNPNIHKTALAFLQKLDKEYKNNLQSTKGTVQKQWEEKRNVILDRIRELWVKLMEDDKILCGSSKSGIQARIQDQHPDERFVELQSQLISFLHSHLILLMQNDSLTRKNFLSLIERIIGNVRMLSKHERSIPFFPVYPHKSFELAMEKKCKEVESICLQQLPVVEDERRPSLSSSSSLSDSLPEPGHSFKRTVVSSSSTSLSASAPFPTTSTPPAMMTPTSSDPLPSAVHPPVTSAPPALGASGELKSNSDAPVKESDPHATAAIDSLLLGKPPTAGSSETRAEKEEPEGKSGHRTVSPVLKDIDLKNSLSFELPPASPPHDLKDEERKLEQERKEHEDKERLEKERKEHEDKERLEQERKEREDKERLEKERKEREDKERKEKEANVLEGKEGEKSEKEEEKEKEPAEEINYIVRELSELPGSGVPEQNVVYFNRETGDYVILGTIGDNTNKPCKGNLEFLTKNPAYATKLSELGLKARILNDAFDKDFIPQQTRIDMEAQKESEQKERMEREERERQEEKEAKEHKEEKKEHVEKEEGKEVEKSKEEDKDRELHAEKSEESEEKKKEKPASPTGNLSFAATDIKRRNEDDKPRLNLLGDIAKFNKGALKSTSTELPPASGSTSNPTNPLLDALTDAMRQRREAQDERKEDDDIDWDENTSAADPSPAPANTSPSSTAPQLSFFPPSSPSVSSDKAGSSSTPRPQTPTGGSS